MDAEGQALLKKQGHREYDIFRSKEGLTLAIKEESQ